MTLTNELLWVAEIIYFWAIQAWVLKRHFNPSSYSASCKQCDYIKQYATVHTILIPHSILFIHMQSFPPPLTHSSLTIQASVHDLHHCNTTAGAQLQCTPVSHRAKAQEIGWTHQASAPLHTVKGSKFNTLHTKP